MSVFAQRPADPKQEKLLNGLKLLMWPDQSAARVTIKVRVHSGSAFDPQGKEGVMSMLTRTFFPNDNAQEFFQEDLGGGLTITSNYDYIQIEASSRPEEFLTLMESIAGAVSNPTVDKETTDKIKAAQLALLAEREKDPAYVADRAVAERLLGTFPYGRPELGTTETVQKIVYADLLDAKQRFLASDNATVAITGKFDQALAYRAARRFFGSWLKSDKLAPSTFKQPDAPDQKLASFTAGTDGSPQVRYALRGVARSDRLYPASLVLGGILSNRLQQNLSGRAGFVRSEAHILPGTVVFGFEGTMSESTPANLPKLLLAMPISQEEFNAAKTKAAAVRPSETDLWLDADTYKLASPAADAKALDAVTLADVQLLAESLGKNPVVAVAVNAAEKPAAAN